MAKRRSLYKLTEKTFGWFAWLATVVAEVAVGALAVQALPRVARRRQSTRCKRQTSDSRRFKVECSPCPTLTPLGSRDDDALRAGGDK